MSEKNSGSASAGRSSSWSFFDIARQLMPHVVLVIVYLLYLVIGGVVFSTLESEAYMMLSAAEQAKIAQAHRTKLEIIEAFDDTSNKSLSFNISLLLDSLIDTVDHPDWKAGRKKVLMDGRTWSVPSAVLFALTTITTIGYGDIVPETVGGKSFCVIFSVIGVPFSFFLLGNFGQLLAIGFIRLWRWIRRQNWRGWEERRKERDSRVKGFRVRRKTEQDRERGRPNVTMKHMQSVRFKTNEDTCPVNYHERRAHSAQCVSAIIHDGDIEMNDMETKMSSDEEMNTNNSGLDQNNRRYCGEGAALATLGGTFESNERADQRNEVKGVTKLGVDSKKDAIEKVSENDDTDGEGFKDGDYHADEIPVWLVFLTLCGYMCISAFAFSTVEGWNFGTALYFTFITLTTIGFGDVVPEEQYTPARFLFCIVFTVCGLAVTSMCIALAQDRVSKGVKLLYQFIEQKLCSSNTGQREEADPDSRSPHTSQV